MQPKVRSGERGCKSNTPQGPGKRSCPRPHLRLRLGAENVVDKPGVGRLYVEIGLANLIGVGQIPACLYETRSDQCLDSFDQIIAADRCFLHDLPSRGDTESLDG